MKILVTGGSGFIARYIINALKMSGNDIYATYRSEIPEWSKGAPMVHWVKTNLNQDLTDQIPVVDSIVSAAAIHYESRPEPSLEHFIETNILGVNNLCRYAQKVGVRKFIHLSTVSIYGSIDNTLLCESDSISDPNFYGSTKWLGERVLREYQNDFESFTLRLPGVVGPHYYICWLGRVLKKALNNDLIEVFNPENLFNNVTDVNQVSKFINYLLTADKKIAGEYNVASNHPISINRVIELLITGSKSQSRIISVSAPKKSFLIDLSKTQNTTGFCFENTEDVIKSYVASCTSSLQK
jgi:nucleoside-diphosphate-sugar epimerase